MEVDRTIRKVNVHIYKYTLDIKKYKEFSGQMKRKKRNENNQTERKKHFLLLIFFNWSYMCGHQTTKLVKPPCNAFHEN